MMHDADHTLSVVVPAYNEEDVLPEFHRRLAGVLETMRVDAEVIYVNDGSSDGTLAAMRALQQADARVAVLDMSRNFGKEIALTAGLDRCRGDAVVVIDADLQDPPETIPELVTLWKSGYDNVYAQRTEREGEPWFKRATAHTFYRVMRRMGRLEIPVDTGDFRLLSRRAVTSLIALREQHRYMKGLYSWIGFPAIGVPYRREPRSAGRTKWNYWKLWNLALDGITSFSTAPLKVATYLGFTIAIMAFVYAVVVISKTLLYGDPVRGYPSLMVVVLFLGGIQLLALGVIGEYLGRMFNETKQRPLYFVNAYVPARNRIGATAVGAQPAGGTTAGGGTGDPQR